MTSNADRDIQFVYSDDWLFVYVDGSLIYENHATDVEPEWLLEQLGFKPKVSMIRSEFFRDSGVYERRGVEQNTLSDTMREKFNTYLSWGDVV